MKKLIIIIIVCFVGLISASVIYKATQDPIIEKEIIEKDMTIDYSSSINFEDDLNNKKDVNGKVVKLLVKDIIEEESKLVAGKDLILTNDKSKEIKIGDYIFIKITTQPIKENNKWHISYNFIDKKESNLKLESTEEDKNEDKEEEKEIIMLVLPSEYIGKDYKEIESEMKKLGFTNIKLENKETTDSKNKNNTIADFTIDGKSYERNTRFKASDEVKIVYWVLKEETKKESLYYSTNTVDTVKNGNAGKYAYKLDGKNYDTYYIIDFDEKKVYYFLEGEDNNWCDKLNIKSGDLKTSVIFTYSDGSDKWEEKFKFDGSNTEKGIWISGRNQQFDGFKATNLNNALELRNNKTIKQK